MQWKFNWNYIPWNISKFRMWYWPKFCDFIARSTSENSSVADLWGPVRVWS